MRAAWLLVVLTLLSSFTVLAGPTQAPTRRPSREPTRRPSRRPTFVPSKRPTRTPTLAPTRPTARPTFEPTSTPTRSPTQWPSLAPTLHPTVQPTTQLPTYLSTNSPSRQPNISPTSANPTHLPTSLPTNSPSRRPSIAPTSASPTQRPTTQMPTDFSTTLSPSLLPSSKPTLAPSSQPTLAPSSQPTLAPSSQPTLAPSSQPTLAPSSQPTLAPSSQPTLAPSALAPTQVPITPTTSQPTFSSTISPSTRTAAPTTLQPSNAPSFKPTAAPTAPTTLLPTIAPSTSSPSTAPTTLSPAFVPTSSPSSSKAPNSAPSPRPIPMAFTVSVTFHAPLTPAEFQQVQVAFCEAIPRLAGTSTSAVNCSFTYLTGSSYKFTMEGDFNTTGLTIDKISTDIQLATALQHANDGTPLRDKDFNAVLAAPPAEDATIAFFKAQQLLLILCAIGLCCCLLLCVGCWMAGKSRAKKKRAFYLAKSTAALELAAKRQVRKSHSSQSSEAPLGPNHVSSSRSGTQHSHTIHKHYPEQFFPPLESTDSSPRGSLSSVVPPPPLPSLDARGSESIVPPPARPRNHSFSSSNFPDSRDFDDMGDLSHHLPRPSSGSLPPPPPDLGFTPLAPLPENRSTRDSPSKPLINKHVEPKKNAPSRAAPSRSQAFQMFTDDDGDDSDPPLPPPDIPPPADTQPPSPPPSSSKSSIPRATLSARFSASLAPLEVNVVPPSPHYRFDVASPQPLYQYATPTSPAPSPTVQRPFATSPSSYRPLSPLQRTPSLDLLSTQIPTDTFGDLIDDGIPLPPPSRAPPSKPSLSVPPSSAAHSRDVVTSAHVQPTRRATSRYSLEAKKGVAKEASASSQNFRPPGVPAPFSQGTAELKFTLKGPPRKKFTTSDEDREADRQVPSLSGGSAKFVSSYKGNPLWDSATASLDTRNRL